MSCTTKLQQLIHKENIAAQPVDWVSEAEDQQQQQQQ